MVIALITVLVRVKNYIMTLTDQGKPVILVLLDLSTAFDKIDHNVLFSMLKSWITPNGSVKNLEVIFDQCINMYEHVTSYAELPTTVLRISTV